ncbi:putative baseplate assembly protein [Lentzea sp. NPDC051208]|uniref:putative baseplate assembly protein n=1 Tax=Lentzea sp. NPDC051208 TaxID=3154642 RepID=UPI00341FEDAF
MALPSPELDDRRFQDLVDDAKRMVMRKCPEWTDHNVSDPGVTLIETFAFMTDQLLYRLNQVPDRLYVKFLDLIGMRLLPPTPAKAPVTFWLSAPATVPLVVRRGTEVATIRTETEDPITFSTVEDLDIEPCELKYARTIHATNDMSLVHTEELRMRNWFRAFAEPPVPGDQLLLGLDEAVPSCAVRIDFEGRVEGIGVDPDNPPLAWEAWDGEEWQPCEVSLDETGGLNRDGSVVLHVPPNHEAAVLHGERAGWLRARVTEPEEGQSGYTATPRVHALSASTVGGTVTALHAEIVHSEELGECEGVPGQRFAVSRRPVLAVLGVDPVVETSSDEGWTPWSRVDDFAASGPDDLHVVLDPVAGEVHFGPVVRDPGRVLRQHGAVPEKDAVVRIRGYATGGGIEGNVGTGAIRTLKSSIPFVAEVENRYPARGGTDGETVEEAKTRGPVFLRTRSRAVTTEDFEVLAKNIAPELSRVRCIPAGTADTDAGGVRVLVVPAAPIEDGRIELQDLAPDREIMNRIAAHLEDVRVVGTRVVVEPPLYRGVTVVARLVARPRVNRERVQEEALRALYTFLSPLPGGGPDGAGWPFGRPLQAGEVFAVLQRVHGVELVEDVRLFTANPVTGERGQETQRIRLEANSLVFSFEHHVRVEES